MIRRILIIYLLGCANLLNAEEKDLSSPLIINVLQSYPFAYVSEGKSVGTYWEYVGLLEELLDIPISRYIVPKSRVVENLKTGAADVAILFRSVKLDPFVHYVEKVRTVPIIVVARAGSTINSFEDLYGLDNIGIFRSASISRRFDFDERINKISVSSYPSLVDMLKLGRLSAVTGNGLVLNNLIAEKCLSETLTVSSLEMGTREQWLVLSKASPRGKSAGKVELISALKRSMRMLKEEGALDKIFNRHLSSKVKCQ
jgi:ABC-type amino acid transport substrate-binding protein